MSEHEALAILREVVALDPWQHSSEGLDDCCHFCGSDTAPWVSAPERPDWDRQPRHLHHRRCVWIRACTLLGVVPPGDHFTFDTKPGWLNVPPWFLRGDAIETLSEPAMKELM